MDQSIGKIVLGRPERYLWAIRHHCVDAAIQIGMRTSELELPPPDGQEAALIEALYGETDSNDKTAHLIYADWLDERGFESAAIAHRLPVAGYRWQVVGAHTCFIGRHIMGMCFGRSEGADRPGKTHDELHCWITSNEKVLQKETPQAEYVGRMGFKDAIAKIYEVSWLYHQLDLSAM